MSFASMRLAIDIRSLVSSAYKTGVGVYAESMISSLSSIASEYNVKIVLFSSGRRSIDIQDTLRHLTHKHLAIPNKLLNALWLLNFGPSIRNITRADYFWLPNINIIRKESIPYCMTVHDISFVKFPQYLSINGTLWHKAVRFKSLLQGAQKIIAVSENTKCDLLENYRFLHEHNIQVIYPGLESPTGQAQDRFDTIAGYTIPSRYILYVGSLEPRKNIYSIIKAFEQLSKSDDSLHLIIAGPFGWSVQKLVERISSHPRILWFGYISNDERSELYRNALALIWPSFYEGYGFPPIEALLHGTTVITSYRSSLPEILRQNAFYVNPYNYSELIEVIQRVLTFPDLTSKKFVDRRTTWNDSARSFLELITQR